MALEGSIRDFSLADIFQLIGIQRKTGVLTLRRREEEVKVSFLGGMVVNADSHNGRVDDRLGSVLTKTGKVSPEDLQKALRIQKQTLKKLGVVLIENEIARPEDLREALNIQITQIVYRLFRWKDGDYNFEQDVQVDYDKENFGPMSAESILMEGMRMIDEWPVIERKITSFRMIFERVPLGAGEEPIVDEAAEAEESGDGDEREDDFDLIFGGRDDKPAPTTEDGRIRLSREEGLVYAQVDGQRSVQDIIERVMMPEFEVCRALYDFANRNLIVEVVGDEKGAQGPRERGAKARPTGPGLAHRLAVVVPMAAVAWVVLSWLGGVPRRNPLNFLVKPPIANATVAGLTHEAAVSQARRINQAIETYALCKRGYPSSLSDLVELGLIAPADLTDPWGGEIGFEVGADRIVVRLRSGPEPDAPVITEEHAYRT